MDAVADSDHLNLARDDFFTIERLLSAYPAVL